MMRELSTEEAYELFTKAFFDYGCNVVFVDDIEMEMSQSDGWRKNIVVTPVKVYDTNTPASRFTVPTRAFYGTTPRFKVFVEESGRFFFERDHRILNGHLRFCKKSYDDMTAEITSAFGESQEEDTVQSVVDDITNPIA